MKLERKTVEDLLIVLPLPTDVDVDRVAALAGAAELYLLRARLLEALA